MMKESRMKFLNHLLLTAILTCFALVVASSTPALAQVSADVNVAQPSTNNSGGELAATSRSEGVAKCCTAYISDKPITEIVCDGGAQAVDGICPQVSSAPAAVKDPAKTKARK
jgi:hypothetical protein